MEERRKTKRFATNLKAQYFLKARKVDGKECTVINISQCGLGLEFYTAEKIVAGSALLLEIFATEVMELTNVEGIVKWVKQGEKDFIGGIEVTSKSDKEKLTNLIKFTLGL